MGTYVRQNRKEQDKRRNISQMRAAEAAADVMQLAAKAGCNLHATGGLTMTGLLSYISRTKHDEWMHWVLQNQGRNFKRFSGADGILSEQHIAQSMNMFDEEKHMAEVAAADDDPNTRPSELAVEVPRQRTLEQALRLRASSELDRMLLSTWEGPIDDAVHLLGHNPEVMVNSSEAPVGSTLLASPIFANPRGLTATRAPRLPRLLEQKLARLAQPTRRTVPCSSDGDSESTHLDAPVIQSDCVRFSPKVQRPRSAAPLRDRFDLELDAAASACWAGDERAAREYTQRLQAVGMARTVRRINNHTVADLLKTSALDGQERADMEAALGTRTTLLHIAAANGHPNVVAALLGPSGKNGRQPPHGRAIINAANDQRCTALIAAVMTCSSVAADRSARVVSTLISAGANVNALGNCGVSALNVAAAEGHAVVVRSLLSAGGAVDAAWEGGATSLLLAAQQGHLDVCQTLLLAGADAMRSDADGLTPLMAAAMNGHEAVAAEVMRYAANARQGQKQVAQKQR